METLTPNDNQDSKFWFPSFPKKGKASRQSFRACLNLQVENTNYVFNPSSGMLPLNLETQIERALEWEPPWLEVLCVHVSGL